MALGSESTDLLGHGHRGERESSEGKHCGYSVLAKAQEMVFVFADEERRERRRAREVKGEGDIYTRFSQETTSPYVSRVGSSSRRPGLGGDVSFPNGDILSAANERADKEEDRPMGGRPLARRLRFPGRRWRRASVLQTSPSRSAEQGLTLLARHSPSSVRRQRGAGWLATPGVGSSVRSERTQTSISIERAMTIIPLFWRRSHGLQAPRMDESSQGSERRDGVPGACTKEARTRSGLVEEGGGLKMGMLPGSKGAAHVGKFQRGMAGHGRVRTRTQRWWVGASQESGDTHIPLAAQRRESVI